MRFSGSKALYEELGVILTDLLNEEILAPRKIEAAMDAIILLFENSEPGQLSGRPEENHATRFLQEKREPFS